MPKVSRKEAKGPLQEVVVSAMEVEAGAEGGLPAKPSFAALSAEQQGGAQKVEFRRVGALSGPPPPFLPWVTSSRCGLLPPCHPSGRHMLARAVRLLRWPGRLVTGQGRAARPAPLQRQEHHSGAP